MESDLSQYHEQQPDIQLDPTTPEASVHLGSGSGVENRTALVFRGVGPSLKALAEHVKWKKQMCSKYGAF